MMEDTNGSDIKMLNTAGMHKSAIIYRDDSARFIYVCFHCGQMFNNNNDTLLHIESHFQLVNVVVDQFTVIEKEEKFFNGSGATPMNESIDIKLEIVDNAYEDILVSTKSEPINDNDDQEQIEAAVWKETPSQSDQVLNVKSTSKKSESRPYRCHKCPQNWRFVNELTKHLKTHDDLLQLCRCKECDRYCKNRFQLRFHVLESHFMQTRFYCNACSSDFHVSQNKQFEKHLKWHKDNDRKKLWTNIVDGMHEQSNDFTKFEEIDSFADEQHSCGFCTRQFYIKSNLDVHMKRVHSGQRRLQCGQCGSIFSTPMYYYAHQLEHQRVGPNIVERDDNVLLANLVACIDERIICDEDESNKQSYRCLLCNKKFESRHDIRSHIRYRHIYKGMFPPPSEPKKEFICDFCGMRLKSKATIKSHLLTHTDIKTHPCKICGKKFRQIYSKTIHERQHTGEKPYQCHQCGKGFISKGLLNAHQISHDDSKYPCETCGRVFNLPSGYRKHVQTHRSDRAFKCTICSKSFNTRTYLTNHMSSHSGKQYKCNFCELILTTADGRRQHQRYKHLHATT